MNNIESAEILSDLLGESEKLNFTHEVIEAICKARYETMCKHSKIGEHKCNVKIYFMPQSEQTPITCDTCLQREIQDLIRNHHIWTVGSCCGHGVKQGFIQVSENCVEKMIALGYQKYDAEENGNGLNCFIPKTIIYREEKAKCQDT